MKKSMRIATALLALGVAVSAAVLLVGNARARAEGKSSQAVEVKVDNFTFAPETLTVPTNSTVTWVNKDDIPHVVEGTDRSFKSKALDTDDSYSYKFTKAGTYQYYCPIHPKMTGKIVVK